ncbi:hypothetical protein OIU85_029772 [Salix viminalis]|uniref:Uncharacterized protein n=1 Tax=Salix viminalis TaxID=40686 RepID=A0A9Q0T7Z9_SALVM|nr:hypothetical protein OIU85_029772 [Salix viminalis]
MTLQPNEEHGDYLKVAHVPDVYSTYWNNGILDNFALFTKEDKSSSMPSPDADSPFPSLKVVLFCKTFQDLESDFPNTITPQDLAGMIVNFSVSEQEVSGKTLLRRLQKLYYNSVVACLVLGRSGLLSN